MKYIFTWFAFSLALSASGQDTGPVELNWKINPDETLRYRTLMTEVDSSILKLRFGGLLDAFEDENNLGFTENLFQKLNKSLGAIDYMSFLKSKRKGVIDILMKIVPKEAPEDDTVSDISELFYATGQDVVLRGGVYATGGIQSFWVKNKQKNLIALFFQLPEKPVKVGDSWALDVSFIENDESFVCDSSHKMNQVTLIDLKEIEGEKIAVIKYQLSEYVEGIFHSSFVSDKDEVGASYMHFSHQAIAEFSVDRGRWKTYQGLMEFKANGLMIANSRRSLSLIEE